MSSKTNLGSFLVTLWLKTQCCHCCGSRSIPGLGIFACGGHGQKKKKKNKGKGRKERRKGERERKKRKEKQASKQAKRKKEKEMSSRCGTVERNLTRNNEGAGSIPDLARWVKDPALL